MRNVKMILLGAMIAVTTISVISVNTYSIFTSSVTSSSNVFQTGTLKVLLNGDAEDTNKMLNLDYGKIGAGDSIKRDFYIKNIGSLSFISKLSILDENNPLFNYLRCEVNVYYKDDIVPEKLEYKRNVYSGTLADFSKSAILIQYEKDQSGVSTSELAPNKNLRCEIILALPEDVVLPDDFVNGQRVVQASNNSNSININIYTTQENNTGFE